MDLRIAKRWEFQPLLRKEWPTDQPVTWERLCWFREITSV